MSVRATGPARSKGEAKQTVGAKTARTVTKGEVLIAGEGLSKSFGLESLFQDLDIAVSRSQRIGLLGANGTGKSTLLKVLAGQEPADSGNVQRKRRLSVGFLQQVGDKRDEGMRRSTQAKVLCCFMAPEFCPLPADRGFSCEQGFQSTYPEQQ